VKIINELPQLLQLSNFKKQIFYAAASCRSSYPCIVSLWIIVYVLLIIMH